MPATIKGEHEDDVAVIEDMKGTTTHPPTNHFKLMVLHRPPVALG